MFGVCGGGGSGKQCKRLGGVRLYHPTITTTTTTARATRTTGGWKAVRPVWCKRTGGKKVVFFRFPSPEREWPVSYIKESRLRSARWVRRGVRGCRVQSVGPCGVRKAGRQGRYMQRDKNGKIKQNMRKYSTRYKVIYSHSAGGGRFCSNLTPKLQALYSTQPQGKVVCPPWAVSSTPTTPYQHKQYQTGYNYSGMVRNI